MAATEPDSVIGAEGPVERRPVTVQRQVRSSAITDEVKQLHKYRCQVCGIAIAIDLDFYAEGAHIRAIGHPHDGPDATDNVLCLCPNDHVRFDYGAIHLTDDLMIVDTHSTEPLGRLRTVPQHAINLDHVAYHRSRQAAAIDGRLIGDAR
jgi:putative restriction endonuclease